MEEVLSQVLKFSTTLPPARQKPLIEPARQITEWLTELHAWLTVFVEQSEAMKWLTSSRFNTRFQSLRDGINALLPVMQVGLSTEIMEQNTVLLQRSHVILSVDSKMDALLPMIDMQVLLSCLCAYHNKTY